MTKCKNGSHDLKKVEPSPYLTDNYVCTKCSMQFRKPFASLDIYVQRIRGLIALNNF